MGLVDSRYGRILGTILVLMLMMIIAAAADAAAAAAVVVDITITTTTTVLGFNLAKLISNFIRLKRLELQVAVQPSWINLVGRIDAQFFQPIGATGVGVCVCGTAAIGRRAAVGRQATAIPSPSR